MVKFRILAVILLSISAFSWSAVLSNLPRALLLIGAVLLVYVRPMRFCISFKYGILAFFFILTSFYSMLHAPDPLRAFIKSFELILLGVFLVGIADRAKIESHDYLIVFLNASFIIMAFSVLPYSIIYKGTLVELSSEIPALNSNTVGSIGGLMFLYSINYRARFMFLMASLFLLLSYSASAVLAVLMAVASVFFLGRSSNSRKSTQLLIKVIALTFLFSFLVFCVWFYLLDDETRRLSGRYAMWELGIELLLMKVGFFHGVGLGNVAVYFEALTNRRVTLHNSYLEIYFSLGGFFITLIILYILRILWEGSRSSYLFKSKFYLQAIIFILVKGFMSSALSYYTFDLLALCFVLMALTSNNHRLNSP